MTISLQWTGIIWCLMCLIHSGFSMQPNKQMKMIHEWKSLEFDFPNEAVKSSAIRSGDFIPGAAVPIDVDAFERGPGRKAKVFVTIPRFQHGVPVTVGYVTDKVSSSGNPIIAPYPNWEWNRPGGNCNGITSVYRVRVDACKRIWILDTGKHGDEQVCPPQILIFSLENDRLISKYKFPSEQYQDSSLFVTPVIDIQSSRSELKCLDTYVYIADVTGFSLLVYSLRANRSWKITNKYFYPYPDYGTFHIKGDSFDLMDGILGMALSPVRRDGDRVLYFHSLAGVKEGWVKTSVIKNETRFKSDSEAAVKDIHIFEHSRSSQSAPEDVDRNGVMYFGLMSDLALGCWNTNNFPAYGGNSIEKVVVNSNTLQFASGLKIVPYFDGTENLWVLTSSFQKYMTGRLRSNEVNFRIQVASTDDLVRGTRCESPSSGGVFFPGDQRQQGSTSGHYVPKPYYPSTTPYPSNYQPSYSSSSPYPSVYPHYHHGYPSNRYPPSGSLNPVADYPFRQPNYQNTVNWG